MRGHVKTPDDLAYHMVTKLFNHPPSEEDRVLYPGSGEGPFIAAVHRFCNDQGYPEPEGTAIETHPSRMEAARNRFGDANVEFLQQDFLAQLDDLGEFDYIIGNPPYVPIEGLDEDEKRTYRERFNTAKGRFDLYILFFEQALRLLAENGRLVFITPEKFEYVDTAVPLRRLMATYHIEEIEHVQENAFDGYITYPVITTLSTEGDGRTRVKRRDGSEEAVELPHDGQSWAPYVRRTVHNTLESGVTLGDICERISCGVATGRDSIFVQSRDEVPIQLKDEEWTYPTISGRQLEANNGPDGNDIIICPYDERGNLVPEDKLGVFGDWANLHRKELEARSCVEKGKAWYSWHENPPMEDVLDRTKILFKDITDEPEFWLDREGEVLPRHTVYYAVPEEHVDVDELLKYLNSDQTGAWLEANCQKAHNDYLRLQSKILKELPIPERFGKTVQQTLV